MAAQRFLPDVDRTRRAAGVIFLSVGGLIAVLVGWAATVFGRVTATTIVFIAVPAALAALGARLAFRREVVIDVDPDQRTVVEYVVNASAHSKIDLYVLETPGKARRKMGALARAWRLPCRSYGGVVRAAGALDQPLHERLRDDREAMVAAPLRPEWGLRIESIFRGHAIVSTHRSWAPLSQGAFIALAPLVVLWATSSTGLISTLREASGDLLDRVLLGLMAVVGVALLWKLGQGARDTFFPGAVRVTERGVSYRGRRMAFADIEEVTSGVPIKVVGDRRIAPHH